MFGCFYKNELENKMPGMTIENIAAACEGTSGTGPWLRRKLPEQ